MKTIQTPATPTTFFLPADHLRAAFQCVSTESKRYYLNGVYVHTLATMPGAPVAHRLTALDGHQMLIVDLPEGCHIGEKCVTQDHPGKGFLLQADHTDKAWKARASGTLWVYGDVTTGILQFVDKREGQTDHTRVGVLEFTVIDGTFPDYHRVIARGTGKCGSFQYNPDNIARLQKAADVFSKGTWLRIVTGDTVGDPAAVEFYRLPFMRGTVMPILQSAWRV
jgi:hypothetical protein